MRLALAHPGMEPKVIFFVVILVCYYLRLFLGDYLPLISHWMEGSKTLKETNAIARPDGIGLHRNNLTTNRNRPLSKPVYLLHTYLVSLLFDSINEIPVRVSNIVMTWTGPSRKSLVHTNNNISTYLWIPNMNETKFVSQLKKQSLSKV